MLDVVEEEGGPSGAGGHLQKSGFPCQVVFFFFLLLLLKGQGEPFPAPPRSKLKSIISSLVPGGW